MSVITLNKDNFNSEVLESPVPVLIDFWAEWCGPCRMQAPAIDQIAEEFKDSIKVGKVNIDEEPELAAHYSISVIPTLVFFKEGQIARAIIGVHSKEQLIEELKLQQN